MTRVFLIRPPPISAPYFPSYEVYVNHGTSLVAERIERDNPDYVDYPQLALIKKHGSMYAEKWIEEVGLHFGQYSTAPQRPLLAGTGPVGQFRRLQTKSFSGDVSGTIGETLLATTLRRTYGIREEDIVHLRPGKRRMRYPCYAPDFYIRNPTKSLKRDLNPENPSEVFGPILAEAKGITTYKEPTVTDRLLKAVFQLVAGFSVNKRTKYGIASLAVRNPDLQDYDLFLVVVVE